MEPSIFTRLWAFIKAVHTTYIRQAITGAGLVGCSVYPLFFNHIPAELLRTWIGVWALLKMLGSAYLGSYFAALGAYHVEKRKNKHNEKSQKKVKEVKPHKNAKKNKPIKKPGGGRPSPAEGSQPPNVPPPPPPKQ